MMSDKVTTGQRVLIIEDSPPLVDLYKRYLENEPLVVESVTSGKGALRLMPKLKPDLLVLDLQLPDFNGMEIVQHVVEKKLPISIIIITGHATVDLAVDAMRLGVFDFIEKPFTVERFLITVRNALEQRRLENKLYQVHLSERVAYHGFIGSSDKMQAVYRIIDHAAPSKATVFITGESGTGKELCAEAIHQESPRRDHKFIALNCTAIPSGLMESEIFGHVKGAFTGAHSTRQGAASLADGGTLFLDEICDMDLDLQTKLLRFVQSGLLQKVGSNEQEKVDVRFICATNKDPIQEVREGRFREDLFYRLHVIPISLPPLRERGDDVLYIAQKFLQEISQEEGKKFKSLSNQTEEIFLHYDWPGNVRQLQNVIRNIVVLNNCEVVPPELLPTPLDRVYVQQEGPQFVSLMKNRQGLSNPSAIDFAKLKPLWQIEKNTIETTLQLCEYNIAKTAAILEISSSTIYRKRLLWKKQAKD